MLIQQLLAKLMIHICNCFVYLQRLKKLTRPAPQWGPARQDHRALYFASLREEYSKRKKGQMHLTEECAQEMYPINEKSGLS